MWSWSVDCCWWWRSRVTVALWVTRLRFAVTTKNNTNNWIPQIFLRFYELTNGERFQVLSIWKNRAAKAALHVTVEFI